LGAQPVLLSFSTPAKQKISLTTTLYAMPFLLLLLLKKSMAA
jgi:hypothetical protein